MARVAAGYSQDPRVVVEWAWADVLVWEAALVEVERVQALGRLADMVTTASLTASAFHDPARLAVARQEMLQAGRLPLAGALPADPAQATVALLDRLALQERVARRRARQGEADDPFAQVIREH